jgi:hypothetical protein
MFDPFPASENAHESTVWSKWTKGVAIVDRFPKNENPGRGDRVFAK